MTTKALYDRVVETTTTTGTGTLTLAGVVNGFQSFAAVGDGNPCYYCVEDVDADGNPSGDWETGEGTYTASGTTLSRTTVFSSSNSNALVNFGAGTKRVFISVPAEKTFYVADAPLDPAAVAWAAWFKADAITPQSDDTALSTWPDSSGNANDATESGSNRPHYRTAAGALGLNGYPGVTFTDSSSQRMSTSAGGAGLTGNFYFACVMQTPGSSGFANILSFGDSGVTGKRRSMMDAPNGSLERLWFIGESRDVQPGTSTYPQMVRNRAYFVEISYNGTNLSLWINGVLLADQAPSGGALVAFSSAVLKLGTSPGNSEYWSGTLYEAFFKGATLSAAEQAGVRLYMASKYALYIQGADDARYVPAVSQDGGTQASSLYEVSNYLVSAGGAVLGGSTIGLTGGDATAIAYAGANAATLTVNGVFYAEARGSTQEHMLVSNAPSQNTLAIWAKSGYSAIRYLNGSGYECAALGYDSSASGPSGGYEGFGSTYWEAANFQNTAHGGCLGVIQTGAVNGGSNGQYLRHSYVSNGDIYWHALSVGSATPGIILTLKPNGNLALGGAGSFGSGVGVFFVANGTAPSGTPSGGGLLYVESGALKYKGSSGTVTTLANA